ncbi:helix-turn-helix domain-containing protein [Rubripirellula reticaptiva]|uniref:Chromosomal replication initiator protein DnaA n=1 Tax=Rubripirellula reticaptiva TaxID=2528013 RepID=A0A5C6FE77_9BACT|nr:helix-turn-helix domain-containing protein [Rubripirellula reticaptiva]TWU57871.1 Chromosomal replication initiator protein DnaA [Rubripirellula reticaptiva]
MNALVEETIAVTSFPLERPAVRARRRDTRITSGSLPYFIAGEENRLVTFVSTSETSVFEFGNPILLIGPSGAGKTAIAMHLAARQAVDQSIDGEPVKVIHFPAIDFARQYAEAVAADDLPPLRTEINEAPILVIDDLHLIADKSAAQDELAMRIETRTAMGLATILTCRRLPSEVRGLRPLLVSRVLPGLTIPIELPTGASRLQLLRELALHFGLEIESGLLEVLHDGLSDNLPARSLEAALKQVSLWCRMHESDPTMEAIQSAIDRLGNVKEVSLSSITNAVARYFKMKASELRSSSRKQNLVRARSLAMLLARQMTGKSMHQIGDHFGGRDHTTVLHAIRKTQSLLENDSDLRRAADEVTEKLCVAV